jgi:hypothetical protein
MSHEVSEQNLVGTSKDEATPKGWHVVVAILSGAVVGFLIGIFIMYFLTELLCISVGDNFCRLEGPLVLILMPFPVGPFFGAIGGYLLLSKDYSHNRIGFAATMIIFSIRGSALFTAVSFILFAGYGLFEDWICFPYCGFAMGVPVAMALFQKLRGTAENEATANRNTSL